MQRYHKPGLYHPDSDAIMKNGKPRWKIKMAKNQDTTTSANKAARETGERERSGETKFIQPQDGRSFKE